MIMGQNRFVLGFSAFSGIGTVRFNKLIEVFGSAENAWNADGKDVQDVIGPQTGKQFNEFRKSFNLQKYAEEIERKNILWFAPGDTDYPKLLKQLNDVIPATSVILGNEATPGSDSGQARMTDGSRIKSGMTRVPFILFAKGNTQLLKNDKTIAIVGTRKVTDYGRQVTEMLTRDLVTSGFTIVSGMALGVDGIAHRIVIESKGNTIAVLGSGVDVPTPREHASLYNAILENNGLILSTFSPGEDAHIGSFPARNAIVAGISRGVVVTEGAEDSGSLITAEYAKKYERPVFAVPGQITSQQSKGTNNLIKQGAIPVSSALDIFDSLGIMNAPQAERVKYPKGTSFPEAARQALSSKVKEEQEIIDLLEQNGPLHFDEIVRTMEKDSSTIGSLLSLMELKGMIRNNSDGKYSLN